MAGLVLVPPPVGGIYRIATRSHEAFAPPPWELESAEGTFGNRFDDPRSDLPVSDRFRCIYGATSAQAAFGETLRRLVPSPEVIRGMADIDDIDESLETAVGDVVDLKSLEREFNPHGIISVPWRLKRQIGHAYLPEDLLFVDIDNFETVAHLNRAFGRNLDLSHLMNQDRPMTQKIARYFWKFIDGGGRRVAGIRYMSRLGAEWECWALFNDRVEGKLRRDFPREIDADDPDLRAVAAAYRLSIQLVSDQDVFLRPWEESFKTTQ